MCSSPWRILLSKDARAELTEKLAGGSRKGSRDNGREGSRDNGREGSRDNGGRATPSEADRRSRDMMQDKAGIYQYQPLIALLTH